MAKLMEMPFRMWTQMNSRNHVLVGGVQLPDERAIFGGVAFRFSSMLLSIIPSSH